MWTCMCREGGLGSLRCMLVLHVAYACLCTLRVHVHVHVHVHLVQPSIQCHAWVCRPTP